MFFGMFSTPFFFILPLVFIFVIARVASSFIRGIGRRPYRNLPDDSQFTPDVFTRHQTQLGTPHNTHQASMFKLAYKLGGRLTVSDIVIETGLDLQEAEELIQGMVDNVHVRMEVNDRGMVTYEFPEIIQRLEGDQG